MPHCLRNHINKGESLPWRDQWTCGKGEADHYHSTFTNRNGSTSFPIHKSCKRPGKETACSWNSGAWTTPPFEHFSPGQALAARVPQQGGGIWGVSLSGSPLGQSSFALHPFNLAKERWKRWSGTCCPLSPIAAPTVLPSRVSRNMCIGSLLRAKRHCYLWLKDNPAVEQLNSSSISWCAN